MKKYLIFNLFITALFLAGCKKDSFERFPAPSWKVDDTGQYAATMSAVVRLPPDILRKAGTGDMIGAFINDQCRGLGKKVVTDSVSVYFLLINGAPAEQSNITFKYYCQKDGSIYVAEKATNFVVDGSFGSIDEPETLELKALR